MTGQQIRTIEWIHGSQYVVKVEVDATRPEDDPDELYFSAETVRHLDRLQKLADDGQVDELTKHGVVYERRSA
jgi:hypothetical protein